jgi:hypothetical protein
MWKAWEGTKLYKAFLKSPKEKDHWEDRGVNGRKGSESILGDWLGMECIQLAQWWAVVNAVMKLRVLAPRS